MAPRFQAIARLPHLPNPAAMMHEHELHELIVVLRGTYAVDIDGARLRGGPGATYYYPAGLRHVPMTTTGSRGQLLIAQWEDDAPTDQPRQVTDGDGRLRAAMVWLWQLALPRTTTPAPVLDGLLLALLYQRSLVVHASGNEALFDRAHRYLAANLAYRLSLDELAEAMGTSPATLHRCFVARTGLPPMRYRRHLRVEAVLALLQAGDDRPLAALATEFGFANAYHLSRAVRAFSGRPPSAWRVG